MSKKFSSPYDVLLHPYVTEKTMVSMERENRMEFLVNMKATKPDIKWAFEKMFDAQVLQVNVKIKPDGKHAILKLDPEVSAEEIGMRIGVF
ncbi:MAG: 50S ribosomal protein L23 [Candidatus Thermoplasmatota archaeon]|nr:50S ribosomal protein L23 [Candidatus Thermoplasmatota archaeon]